MVKVNSRKVKIGRLKILKKIFFFFLYIFSLITFSFSKTFTLKELLTLYGNKPNYLVGYGVVVGLDGTGDSSLAAVNSIANMLRRFNVKLDTTTFKSKNVAAVMVTTTLPPYAKPGMRLDVRVSSIGDAKSLQNGVLLLTPLFGPDNKIYALAQGPVSTGGYKIGTRNAQVQKNFPTTGIVINGAIVEKTPNQIFDPRYGLIFVLKKFRDDPTVIDNIVKTINKAFNAKVCKVVDLNTIKVIPPLDEDPVNVINKILSLKVNINPEPVVVIDERTGTVVMGEDVKIDPVAVAHGNIMVAVKEIPQINKLIFGNGNSTQAFLEELRALTNKTLTEINITQEGKIFMLNAPTLKDLVKTLNALGVSPGDLIAIIEALKAAGAIHAKIIVK